MRRTSLTQYDVVPEDMLNYLKYYGPHFNKKLCKFAVSNMTKEDDEPITPFSKSEVDDLLKAHNVKLKNNILHDATFVANMCKADYLGSSITNEEYLAKYIKDVLDDPDGYDGIVFNRWYADMSYLGIPIEWNDML